MLDAEERMEISVLSRHGRSIARATGRARNTVRRYLRRGGISPRSPSRCDGRMSGGSGRLPARRCASAGACKEALVHRAVRLQCQTLMGEGVSGGAKVCQWSGGIVLLRGGVITGHWLG
jgi:hypothetical protein